MKKIIVILLAAAALLCGCTKSASTVAGPDTPKVAALAYDTASLFYKNTGNRAEIYHVNGRFVKVSLCAIRDEETYKAEYFLTAQPFDLLHPKATTDADDIKKGTFIQCLMYKIEGEGFTSTNQVDIKSLPETSEFKETVEAVEGGAYYVALFDPEGNAHLTFAVVLPALEKTPYKADVTYDPETPFTDPIVVEEDFETVKASLFYRQFEDGKWI